MRRPIRLGQQRDRQGAIAVEFAIMLPIFVAMVLGVIELGWAFHVSQVMASAVREGARFGSMDKTGMIPDGQTVNQKVIDDIRNFLSAAGLPGDEIDISITHEPMEGETESSDDEFTLDDPANEFKLYRITAKVGYDLVSKSPPVFLQSNQIESSIVFRAARSTLVN